MNDTNDTLLALLREADPAAGVRDSAGREAVRRRVIAELEGDASGRHAGTRQANQPRPGRRIALGLGGVAAMLAVVGLAAVIFGGSSAGPTASPAFARTAIRVAEANPRLLVGAAGWTVKYANEFEVDQGQMDFTNGRDTLSIAWAPPRYYSEPDIQDLRRGSRGPEGTIGNPITPGPGEADERYEWITALDRRAFFDYDAGRRSYGLTFAPENGSFISINGYSRHDVMTREQFLAVVDSLYRADVDTWLAALPPEIVRPVEDAAAVDAMLDGIPIPDSVDVDQLRSLALALSRYQLGAKVTGAVACGWLDQWAAAVKAGDDASARQAVDAMATSRDWPMLREMENQGGWSQVVWEYSREMENDNREALLGVAGTETTPDGRVYELSPSYATGLGCDSERRVLREDE
jgi:hypothetical protein